jgi:hypothetical protein
MLGDSEDGALSGASLVWNSDAYGRIGTGETFTMIPFAAGTHKITLTAIDSKGATGTATVVITVATGRLPDTGQEQLEDYEPVPGEDMTYTINPPAYTKLDVSGNALAADAPHWAMVRDDVTGLIWEVKTDDNSIHDKDNEHVWQDIQPKFIDPLNNENFGGYSDWRLPTIQELFTLVQNIKIDPDKQTFKISEAYFPNTMPASYWSATAHGGGADEMCLVDFDYEQTGCHGYESGSYYVLAVRGGQSSGILIDNTDGTVTDTATGLMWQQGEAEERTWKEALDYC